MWKDKNVPDRINYVVKLTWILTAARVCLLKIKSLRTTFALNPVCSVTVATMVFLYDVLTIKRREYFCIFTAAVFLLMLLTNLQANLTAKNTSHYQ